MSDVCIFVGKGSCEAPPTICIMVYFMLYTYISLVMVGLFIVMSCHLWFIFQLDGVIIPPLPPRRPLHFEIYSDFRELLVCAWHIENSLTSH